MYLTCLRVFCVDNAIIVENLKTRNNTITYKY